LYHTHHDVMILDTVKPTNTLKYCLYFADSASRYNFWYVTNLTHSSFK